MVLAKETIIDCKTGLETTIERDITLPSRITVSAKTFKEYLIDALNDQTVKDKIIAIK